MTCWGEREAIYRAIREDGYHVIRNAFPKEWVDDLLGRVAVVAIAPAIGGAAGYQVVDYARKVLNPCTLLGGQVIDIILYEPLIDVVEQLMGAGGILAQAGLKYDKGVGYDYFPLHADFAAGWTHSESLVLTQKHMQSMLSIGCLLYLSPSKEGAFTYLRGTHQLQAPKGSEWSNYSAAEQAEMMSTRVRIDGDVGDLVIFDPRGFHGPDLPSTKPRLAIVFHFYNTNIFGPRQLMPFPVYATDLARLSERQLRVLGVGAKSFYDPLHFGNRIRGTRAYRISRLLLENAFIAEHVQRKLRNLLQKKAR